MRSKGSRRRICPLRLAVPEKIFALLACSIFSTATGAPPRCIRHWRRSAPHPLPLPRSGGGAVWANNCLFKFQSRQRDFLRLTPRQIAVLAALRCPKKSSRCSLARFFRPLRVLRLAASATGGARLRTPYPSPAAGEGPSGQITACSTHRLDIMTSCYWFAVTPT